MAVFGGIRLDERPAGADRYEHSLIQQRADPVYIAHGERAPPPMGGESPAEYERRLILHHQPNSSWRKYDLARVPLDALRGEIGRQIYAESIIAADNFDPGPGKLLKRTKPLPGGAPGAVCHEYVGDPLAWMAQFMGTGQAATDILVPPSRSALPPRHTW